MRVGREAPHEVIERDEGLAPERLTLNELGIDREAGNSSPGIGFEVELRQFGDRASPENDDMLQRTIP